MMESKARSSSLFRCALIGKPLHTFPDDSARSGREARVRYLAFALAAHSSGEGEPARSRQPPAPTAAVRGLYGETTVKRFGNS